LREKTGGLRALLQSSEQILPLLIRQTRSTARAKTTLEGFSALFKKPMRPTVDRLAADAQTAGDLCVRKLPCHKKGKDRETTLFHLLGC